MRGFFGGLMIGLVTVVIAIVALSLLSPVSRRPDVSVGAPQSASVADPAADAGVTGAGVDADLVEMPPVAPGQQDGQQDDLSSLAGADTEPGDKPSVGGATSGLVDPGAAPQAPGVAVNSDVAVVPLVPSNAPGAPQGDTQPEALANPAQPVVPDVSQTGSGFGSGTGADETAPEVATNTDTAPSAGGAGAPVPAPGVEQAPAPSTQPAAVPEAQTAPLPETQAETQPAASTPEVLVQAPAVESQPEAVAPVPELDQTAPDEPAAPSDTQAPSSPQIAALPQAGSGADSTGPTIGKPVVPLTQRGTAPAPAPQAAVVAPDPAAGPPLVANAQPFENTDDRPMMSIVLIDDDAGMGAEALSEFPYPLSFAVDPTAPDAAAKMARHRAAGFEVVALVNLPANATAQDAEVSLSVWLKSVPQVVAVLEGPGTGVQGNRDLSDQVTAIVDGAGLGLIMQSKGLNTAYKLAARDGVPAALVFRDFDGAGQSAQVMRRFLDQAAFRAGQQGAVIMLGRLRPDTISALLIWGLQDRANRVALAPVSAVLIRDAQ